MEGKCTHMHLEQVDFIVSRGSPAHTMSFRDEHNRIMPELTRYGSSSRNKIA